MIWQSSHRRRARAAALSPPATPHTMTMDWGDEDFIYLVQDASTPRWFHGSFAMSIPMAHVSVIPANISPSPTKPESQTKAGFTNCASSAPMTTMAPAARCAPDVPAT